MSYLKGTAQDREVKTAIVGPGRKGSGKPLPPRTRGKRKKVHYRVIEEKSVAAMGLALAMVACLITAGLGLLWGVSVAQSDTKYIAMKESGQLPRRTRVCAAA